VVSRIERSPYRGAGQRHDFVPLYLYEGSHLYLHSYRLGVKLAADAWRFDAFLKHRFEGYPTDDLPASLAGMEKRGPGIDAGVSVQRHFGWGTPYIELMHEVSEGSDGTELRLGYTYQWTRGRLRLRPHVMLALRDSNLNDYYYGVRPGEATAARPAYRASGGVDAEIGLYGAYSLTERWQIIGGVTATRRAESIRESPIVEGGTHTAAMAGLLYNFAARHGEGDARPLIVRVLYGASSDCDMLPIVTLQCLTVHTQDHTSIWGAEVGRTIAERVNGWPLDFAAFVGLIRHLERGFQPDFWQVNAYVKAYYYGFPWDRYVRTRVGFGAGLAYVRRVPFMEVRDQALRGRDTSKLLNYLDPIVDINLGDLVRSPRLRRTYIGVGASHRSGIFGSSQLFGNVDGGSNYLYGYIETSF
jgi:outer membrane protein